MAVHLNFQVEPGAVIRDAAKRPCDSGGGVGPQQICTNMARRKPLLKEFCREDGQSGRGDGWSSLEDGLGRKPPDWGGASPPTKKCEAAELRVRSFRRCPTA